MKTDTPNDSIGHRSSGDVMHMRYTNDHNGRGQKQLTVKIVIRKSKFTYGQRVVLVEYNNMIFILNTMEFSGHCRYYI